MGCDAGFGEKVPGLCWETMDHQGAEGGRKGDSYPLPDRATSSLSLLGLGGGGGFGGNVHEARETDGLAWPGVKRRRPETAVGAVRCRMRDGLAEAVGRLCATDGVERSRVLMDWSSRLAVREVLFSVSEVDRKKWVTSLELPGWRGLGTLGSVLATA